MKKIIALIFLCLFGLNVSCAAERELIKAAVGEGFINGLHSKYLRYFADKLSVDITITTMPFARRLVEVEKGNLDLMVGLQHTGKRQEEFVYIFPHYETLSYRFFSLTKNKNKIKSYDDLFEKYIGVNRHSRYFSPFDKDKKLSKLEVSSLKQNIELLLHGRTDLFIHYQESTIPMLIKMGVEEKISKTQFQPEHLIKHFIAISNQSPLMHRKPELRAIVLAAVKNKDLLKIRAEHYAQINH